MSQEAVERFLGRLLTDDAFRKRAQESIESASREAGFDLNASELVAISLDDIIRLDMVSQELDKGIKRFTADISCDRLRPQLSINFITEP